MNKNSEPNDPQIMLNMIRDYFGMPDNTNNLGILKYLSIWKADICEYVGIDRASHPENIRNILKERYKNGKTVNSTGS
jgi:hypothetical protein